MIFYDPADLAAVAAGTMAPYEPQPYAVMNLDSVLYHVVSPQMRHHVKAASFDRERGLLYVFEPLADGDKPLVHVWKVAGGGAPTPAPAPTTPPQPTPFTPPTPPAEGCGCGPLPTPPAGEMTVVVGSTAELQYQIDAATGSKTIYLANGTYPVSGMGVEVYRPDITIRSLSGDRDSVVIRGEGMTASGEGYGIRIGVSRIIVADLTIRDVQNHGIFIMPEGSPSGFLFHNIRILDCGEQLFKASGYRSEGAKNDGVIRCSALEYTSALDEGTYTNGIDLCHSNNWVISDNLIRNIKAAPGSGGLAGPAILVWMDSANTTVERNRLIDCDMGISFGNSYDQDPSHSGGIIRNNFIKGYEGSDFGICLSRSPGARVINNTVYSPGSWPYSIEIQHPSSAGCLVMNNLVDESLYPDRFGENNPQLVTNHVGAAAGYFADAAGGDLHLSSPNLPAVNAGTYTPERLADIDCQAVTDASPDIGADEYGAYVPPAPATPRVLQPGDYNGDGTSDIGIFRPSQGKWAIRNVLSAYFGSSSDSLVPADYNGDGTTDLAIFRGSSGMWSVRNLSRFYLGGSGDVPVPGDYDGNGVSEAGIFRGSSGMWSARDVTRVYFGAPGDTAIPGRYDSNQSQDIAIFRGGSAMWSVRNITRFHFGAATDTLVPGDYNGAGKWEGGIFCESAGLWSIRNVTRMYLGSTSDLALPVDYNGDGIDGAGIFRDSAGMWSVRNLTRVYFGTTGDIPVTR